MKESHLGLCYLAQAPTLKSYRIDQSRVNYLLTRLGIGIDNIGINSIDNMAEMGTALIRKQQSKLVENLSKRTHFSQQEVEGLLTLYRR